MSTQLLDALHEAKTRLAAHAASAAAEAKRKGLTFEETLAAEDRDREIGERAWVAMEKLLALTPTTVAGCAAVLRQIVECQKAEGGQPLFADCAGSICEAGETILERLADTLEKLA